MNNREVKEGVWSITIFILITVALFVMCFVQMVKEDNLVKETDEPMPTVQEDFEIIPEAVETPMPTPVPTKEPKPESGVYLGFYDVPLDHGLQCFIIGLCEDLHIDSAVVISMIQTESNFKIDAVGDGGNSFGLMQIQKRWHQDRMDKLGVTDLLDPYQNVMVGVDYLKEMIDRYDGNIEMALVGYNAGIVGAEKGWFSVGKYSSDYSRKVLKSAEKLTEGMITVYYSNDPLADFDRWDTEQNAMLAKLPVCADCDEPIQDETAFYIEGEWICESCMDSYRREVLPE